MNVVLFGGGKDKQFFSLLTDAARNLTVCAQVYGEMARNLDKAGEYAARMFEIEKQGDKYTHDTIILLNKLFVTPLEREDILELVVKIDDVVDGLEAVAARLHLYKIKGENRFLTSFATLIQAQAKEISAAMERLGNKQLAGIRENTIKINQLENAGDLLLRESLETLFDQEKDPVQIIKFKEIYETLETVTDRAEDVANALETVVMKNS